MERVPDIVANVFTESGIQIGTLTVDEHQEIMKRAVRNKENYVKQAKNSAWVFFKSFFLFFKICLLIFAAVVALFLIFNSGINETLDKFTFDRNISLSSMGFVSQEESIVMLYSILFTILSFVITIFKTSFYSSLVISAVTMFFSVYFSVIESSRKRMEEYTSKEKREELLKKHDGEFDFSFWYGFSSSSAASDFGIRCFFQEEIDAEIKKALQEQSDCRTLVKYQESN